jgi:hypothetical protein
MTRRMSRWARRATLHGHLGAWAGTDPGRQAAVRMLVADRRLMRAATGRLSPWFPPGGPDLGAIEAALTGRGWKLPRRSCDRLAFLVQVGRTSPRAMPVSLGAVLLPGLVRPGLVRRRREAWARRQ